MRNLFIILSFFLFSTLTHAAAPVITGISPTSATTLTGTPTIYGGLAGGDCSSPDVNQTCNTCDVMAALPALTSCPSGLGGGAPFCSCNQRRVHNDLRVTFSIETSESDISLIETTAGKEDLTVSRAAGSVTTTWSALCGVLNNDDTNCNSILGTKKEGSVYVWVDSNNDDNVDTDETVQVKVYIADGSTDSMDNANDGTEGVINYIIYPGDEKVYVKNASASNLQSGAKAQYVRMWYSPLSFSNAIYGDSSVKYSDIPFDSETGALDIPKVTGLTNGETYHFRTSIVDITGNINAWASDDYISLVAVNGTCELVGVEANPFPYAKGDGLKCSAAGKPDQVLGMLTEDLNCFIATAAYGSSLEPKLNVFRKFRMVFLIHNEWGRKFINWYYNVGPKAARWIATKPMIRSATRLVLWPVYGFANMALQYGLLLATLVFVLLPSALIVGLFFALNKRALRAKI